jgi:circadian clock protein KaiC
VTVTATGGRLSTGVDGLDEVLHGGLIPERGYLVTGAPGTGKSILGLHWLSAGAAAGERALYVNLEESEPDVRTNAAALGFDLDGVSFLDLAPGAESFLTDDSYEVFPTEEVEGDELRRGLREGIDEVDPDRVFIDPVSHLRHLTADGYQFRKQVTALVEYLKQQGATVLFSSQAVDDSEGSELQFLSDGWLHMDTGDGGRTVSVPKFRGSGSERGPHTLRITDAGMAVYPELTPGEVDGSAASFEPLPAGVPEVDQLLGGGIERGTVTVLSGPTGAGKTTLGTQFMKEAAGRGERSVVYTFEEAAGTFRNRSEAVNIPVERMIERGSLALEEVPSFEYTPDQFAAAVREEVERRDARIVMIDGIDGYRNSVRVDEGEVLRELHALGRYLTNRGVTVLLVDTIDSVTGEFTATDSGVSYLADNIVFLRYLEIDGELRKAIGVLKKRMSDFERTLREFAITPYGIKVGEPLTGLRGILQGTPDLVEGGDAGSER